MTEPIPTFEEYVASLGQLTPHVDPMLSTPETEQIRAAADSLGDLTEISRDSLAAWTLARPNDVPVLGLAVGLSQEKLKNILKDRFNTSGWVTLARRRSDELIAMLDEEFDLVRLVEAQRHQVFKFGDILVARGSGRQSASRAGIAGRSVEDEIERIAQDLGLTTATRTRFMAAMGERRRVTSRCAPASTPLSRLQRRDSTRPGQSSLTRCVRSRKWPMSGSRASTSWS